jgi:hypothetical protein
MLFSHIFNPRKRTASRDFEFAVCYLLADWQRLVPQLKKKYKNEWSGFIDDILNGARPYEEATGLLSSFFRQFFRNQDQAKRDAVIAAIVDNNLIDPPNSLRIVAQVSYFLYLAEKHGDVPENLWAAWVNDMSKIFSETGEVTPNQCNSYLVKLAKSYRDRIRKPRG